MRVSVLFSLTLALGCGLASSGAAAEQQADSWFRAERLEQAGPQVVRATLVHGEVEGVRFKADSVEVHFRTTPDGKSKPHLIVATGNVVLARDARSITAERVEIDAASNSVAFPLGASQ